MNRRLAVAVIVLTFVVAFGSTAVAATVGGVLASATVDAIESEMVSLVNTDRQAAGLHGLSVNAWAADTSRAHSERMAAAGDIWHNREVYFAQGRGAMGATLLGENVVQTLSAREAQSAFMESDLHRQNVLDSRFTHIGVGVALNGDGVLFVTQAFAQIPGSGTSAVAGEGVKPVSADGPLPQSRVAGPARVQGGPVAAATDNQSPPAAIEDRTAATASVRSSGRMILEDGYSPTHRLSDAPRKSERGATSPLATVAAILTVACVVVHKTVSARLAVD